MVGKIQKRKTLYQTHKTIYVGLGHWDYIGKVTIVPNIELLYSNFYIPNTMRVTPIISVALKHS
jgi:hypothetical protein